MSGHGDGQQGRIFLEGHEVHFHKKAELYQFRQQVGMIFQDFNLFDHLTALDNVSIALIKVKKIHKAEARKRAYHELERVGLAEKMDLYPAELSGGQKQPVSIARALAMDPKVILPDEPTSALDPELIGEVLRAIVELACSGMTMIMVTHQIGYVKSLTDEILFMENGRIIERGSPEKLLRPDIKIPFTLYSCGNRFYPLLGSLSFRIYSGGGLLSIKRGQLLAAKSLGFSSMGSVFRIILPQAMHRAIPGCGNEIIYLIKYSSLAYIITCIEITGQARDVAATYFRFTESFFVAGLYYLVLVSLAGIALGKLEKKLYIPGFGWKL